MKPQQGPSDSGHFVDKGTFSTDSRDERVYTPWVTKLNKHEGERRKGASILEVSFTWLALLFDGKT